MAYSAVIDIRVNGESKINNVTKQIQKLNQINRSLKPVPDLFQKARGGTEETRKKIDDLKTTLKDTLKKFGEAGKATGFSKTIGGLNSQLSAFRQVANSAKVGSDEFNRSLIAGQNASRELLKAELERVKTLQTLYQADGGMKSTPGSRKQQLTGLLNIGKNLPQTTSALRSYKSELEGAISVVEIGSKEFLQLSTAIDSINQSLKKADILRGRGPKQKDDSNRIKSIKEQTLNIERRITDSTINRAGKNKLLNQLGTTNNAIKNKELDLARQINIETQRNLTMEEKKQRRRGRITQSALIGGGFPLLFGGGPVGAIGGAIGGGLGEAISPGGGFAGSIAVTAAVGSLGQFANSAKELANAVQTTSGTLELMETRSLFSSDAIQKQAKALQEQGKEAELAALLTDELTKALGPAGLGQLAGLAEQSKEMNRQFGILKTSMELFISGPLTQLIKILNNVIGKSNIVNQLDQSLSQLKKENPNEYKRIINQLERGSIKDQINPVSAQVRSFTGSLINPANLQVQGVPVGGFGQNVLGQILQDVNKNLPAANLPFQTNLNTGGGKNNGSGNGKDFSKFELNILDQRIALQKLSGGLLNEEVVQRQRGIIFAKAALKLATAEGNAGKIAVIQRERLLELNKLDSEVNLAKGRDFAEKVIKPQMDLLDKQEKAEFDAGAAIGRRLAPEIEMFNTLSQEVDSMELMNQLQNAETVEQRVQLQLKLTELKLGREISDVNKQDIENLIRKKEQQLENNKAIVQQKALQQEIEGILAGGMTSAVMGLIEGSKTLGQVLADVAKQLASMFLNKAFTKMFGGMFGGGGGFDFVNVPSLGIPFAQGGYVNSPTMGLVGEAGESEYVIPASKMDGAMSRYSAGARGGSVIPGGSGDAGTVSGGSGNAIVEYTGPVLNFNGDEYVPKSAVPQIIGAASKQGAMAGKAQTFNTLRNSRSQRSSLGL